MDPLSIASTAVTLTIAIGRVAHEVDQFTRQVREARRELSDISRELGSLKAAIELLSDDLKTPGVVLPGSLGDILQECQESIIRLDETIQKYAREKLTTRIRYVWSGKETIMMHKGTLSAHRAALDLAVDVINLSLSREIKTTVDETLENTNDIKTGIDETKANTDRILEAIAALQARLPQELHGQRQILGVDSTFMLQKYLDELTEYAETVVGGDGYVSDPEIPRGSFERPRSRASSPTYPVIAIDSAHQMTFTVPYDESARLRGVATKSAEEHHDLKEEPASNASSPAGLGSHSVTLDQKIPERHQGEPQEVFNDAVASQLDLATTSVRQEHKPLLNERPSRDNHSVKPKLLKSIAEEFRATELLKVSGFECLEHQNWRHVVNRQMKQVSMQDIAPANGSFYEERIDYMIELRFRNEIGPCTKPVEHARISISKTISSMIMWARALTMQDDQGHHLRIIFPSRLFRKGPGAKAIAPLRLAMEMQDWDWTTALLAKGYRNFEYTDRPLLGPSSPVFTSGKSILMLALDWNIVLLRPFLEWWLAYYSSSAELKRLEAIAYVFRCEGMDYGERSDDSKARRSLRQRALEILLTCGSPLTKDQHHHFLMNAVGRSDETMVDPLLKHGADLNHQVPDGHGTPLHQATRLKRWDMVRHLARLGASLETEAEIDKDLLKRTEAKVCSPVELAEEMGRLSQFSKAVGKDFGYRNPRRAKISTALRGL
jgi:cell division protein FtsB